MSRYFSSDFHLNSTLINKYAHRPEVDALSSAQLICHNVNETCKKSDVLIHVGDFCLTSPDRHDTEEDVPLDYPVEYWLDNLKPNVFLLEGNHDSGHNLEAHAKSMIVDLNQNYKHVFVSHYPSYHQFYRGPDCSKWTFGRGIVFCGHVHDSWMLHFDEKKNVLNINVGVDCWNMRPVSDVQLTELLDFISHATVKMPKPYLKPDEVEAWKKQDKCAVIENRASRKQEKLAKKGLTPEICEQRRIAAMKAKGLL